MQVAVAVGTTTLVLVTGVKSIVGLGPAIFLSTAALAALPAGRAMDRYGRMPVIAGGFVAGIVATATVALGCLWVSTPLVVIGLALVGASSGTVILSRAAAADMYPAGAACPWHLARPVRRGVRRSARPARLQAAVRRRPHRGHRLARPPLARRQRDHGRRPRDRALGAPRSEADRRGARVRRGGGDGDARGRAARRRSCAGRVSCRRSSRRWRASR